MKKLIILSFLLCNVFAIPFVHVQGQATPSPIIPTPTCLPPPFPCPPSATPAKLTPTVTPITPTVTGQTTAIPPQPTAAPTSVPQNNSSSNTPTPTLTEIPVPTTPQTEPTDKPTPTPDVLGEATKEAKIKERKTFEIIVTVYKKNDVVYKNAEVILALISDESKKKIKHTNNDGKVIFARVKRGKYVAIVSYKGEEERKVIKAQGTEKNIKVTINFEKSTWIPTLLFLGMLGGGAYYLHSKGRLAPLLSKIKNSVDLTDILSL